MQKNSEVILKLNNSFENIVESSIILKKKLIGFNNEINKIIKLIYQCLKKGNKILICGNGGSAADAQHLAAEFIIRLNPKINRKPFPVLNLAQDVSTITACGNDLGYENIFLRNLIAFGKKNDLLIIISTSGKSKNILKVARYSVICLKNHLSVKGLSLLSNQYLL